MRLWFGLRCALVGALVAMLSIMSSPAFAQADVATETAMADRELLVLLQLPPAHFRADGGYSGSYGEGAGRSARRRIAGELAAAHGLTLVTDWPMPLLGIDCFVMSVPGAGSTEPMLKALSADTRVAWAQPMNTFHGQGHADPLYSVQPVAEAWHLSDLHTMSTGRNVKVAVIDSGVDEQHPDLIGQVGWRENFVDRPFRAEQHGTAVAGIIAARADNGVGIVGVAPNARLMALRACWQQADDASVCNTLGLAQALHFAVGNEAQIINLSLAGPEDRLLAQLVDLALARGIAVVAAADRHLPQGGFPASHPGVIAVVSQGDTLAPAGMVAAPGQDVPTTVPGGRWQILSGSSFAAAHVSGLLALMKENGRDRGAVHPTLAQDATGSIDACATLRVMNACACGCGSARAESALPPARP